MPAVYIIYITLRLIAGSSDIEPATSVVRTMDTITILNRSSVICASMNHVTNEHITWKIQQYIRVAHSLLCVIATPFIGASIVSNSSVGSVLEELVWRIPSAMVLIDNIDQQDFPVTRIIMCL